MTSSTANLDLPQSKKLRFRFSIRTLIVCTSIFCLVLGLFLQSALRYSQRRSQARGLIESVGGQIEIRGLSRDGPPGKNWLTLRTGLSPYVERLWTVDLSNSKITAKQAATLKGCDWIRKLDLSGTQLADDDLEFLSGLPKIRELKLNGTAITDEGLKHVKQFERLILFEAANTDVGWEGLTELDQSFAKPKAFADAHIASKFPLEEVDISLAYETVPPNSDEFHHLTYYSYARSVRVNKGVGVPPTAMGGGTFVANQASGPVASSTTTPNLSLSYQPTTAPVAMLESFPKSSVGAGHFHPAYNEPAPHQALPEFVDHRGDQQDPQRTCTPNSESDSVACPSGLS